VVAICTLRRTGSDDIEAIAAIHRQARAEAMPWLPVLHTADEERAFFGHLLDAGHELWVAEVDGRVAGYAVMHEGFLDHLYVSPEHQRRGIGDALFTRAKESMPDGFRWYVFQANQRARRFYEARGGVVVELRDVGGEEQLPDALYEWRPSRAGR
jgi:ribosomal protein S18 acetylase RimI-like enzyme